MRTSILTTTQLVLAAAGILFAECVVPSASAALLNGVVQTGDPLYGPGAPPSFAPMMRQTSAVIDQAGNIWSINNWKPDFDIDIVSNPGGDGIIIFVGLAPPVPNAN
jgi:hypothetical protein